MRPVVLVGHKHVCPLHGMGTVVTGSTGVLVNGRAVVRRGDKASCGAVVVTGSTSEFMVLASLVWGPDKSWRHARRRR